MTIKDVCARCNSGPLSFLDTYANQLYDSCFGKFERPRDEFDFHYDFGRLIRWLLKLSYNASRGTGVDSELLAQYAPAIISEHECSPTHVVVFVGRIGPGRRSNGQLIKPQGTRCGKTLIAGGTYDQWCSTRVITINTYIFNMVIIRDMALDVRPITPLFKLLYGVPLNPDGHVIIPAPSMDVFQAMSGIESWPRGH